MDKAKLSLAQFRAKDERVKYGIGEYDSIDIFKLLRFQEKINIIKMPFDSKFSGTILKKGDIKVILVNSTMSLGKQRFTLAHELYHLKYDNLNIQNPSFEAEAEEFASHFLMSETALEKQLIERECFDSSKISLEDLIFIEQYYMISHKALLRRLPLTKEQKLKFDIDNVQSLAHSLGYPLDLYKSTNEELKIDSSLPETAKKLLDRNKISEGKYREYLTKSGYADILFESHEDDVDG